MTDLTLLELLDLERIDRDLFRASAVFTEPFASYGGQVAAQARRAAGDTVPPDRFAHSLHGYHPRRGDAATARPAPPTPPPTAAASTPAPSATAPATWWPA